MIQVARRAEAQRWLRRVGRAVLALGATSLVTVSAGSAADGSVHYRLVDTLRDSPWTLDAGRFARAADISSDAGGRIYVLDRIQSAVHRRGPERAWSVREVQSGVPEDGRHPERIDAFPGGGYAVLWRGTVDGERRARVALHSMSGEDLGGFETGLDHNDLAIGPGGEIVLTRRVPRIKPSGDGPRPPGGVDVVRADGELTASIEGGDALYFPSGVDVDTDGTIYIIDWRPNPAGVPPPSPRPTARPSDERVTDHPPDHPSDHLPERPPATTGDRPLPGAGSPLSAPDQAPTPPDDGVPEGIVIFGPDLTMRERVPFYAADDVAVGPAGAFVSRQLEIFELRAPEALWSGPGGALSIPFYGAPLHIEVVGPALAASLDHCWFQGLLDFGALGARPADPAFDGRLDRPALAGPWRPARVDAGAGAGVRVLQDRFRIESGAGDAGAPTILAGPWGSESQSVQRWTHGRLVEQIGLCGDDQAWFERRSEARRILDVAVDAGGVDVRGDDGAALTFTIDPELVRARSDDPRRPLPMWTLWPGALDDDAPGSAPGSAPVSHASLRAIDADGGLVAILDGGAGRVILAPARPKSDIVAESRTIRLSGSAAASTDLAIMLDGRAGDGAGGLDAPTGRIALAEPGGRTVHVIGLDGEPIARWAVHDTPVAVAFGPGSDLFVLGAGGWVMRYGSDGGLVARWPMPDEADGSERGGSPPERLALDVTVGEDGRVYVPFVRRSEYVRTDLGERWWRIEDAGVHVFEAGEALAGDVVPASGCLAATDKRAAPTALRRGGLVEVRLEVRGLCPAERDPVRVMLVFDISRSMSWDAALPRARALATALVEALADDADSIGLITFADEPSLAAPLGTARGPILNALAAARAEGDTLLGPALALAWEAFEAAPLAADGAHDVVVVLTDGRPSDYPLAEADALRARGAELRFVVVPRGDYQAVFTAIMANLSGGDRSKVLVAPEERRMRDVVDVVGEARRPDRLFETLEVVDTVPETMRYVNGSAAPAARWDADERSLTWTLGPIERDADVELTYRLEPLVDGLWPTNVIAWADGRDGLGVDQHLVFPVPYVSVWSPASLVERAYLPFASARRCLRPAPRDVVLVIDASRSMDVPTHAGGPAKIHAATDAARLFIERSDPVRDRTAVVEFNASARVRSDLGDSAAAAIAGLARIETAPGTAIDTGLDAAATVLAGARRDAIRAVILLSDGRHSGPPEGVRDQAAALAADGTYIYAIGLGPDVDEPLLRAISASGAYAGTDDADAVSRLFASMDEALRCLPAEHRP